MSKRMGKFYISRQSVMFDPDGVSHVLGQMKFVPVRVEMLAYIDKFEYIGFSDAFDEISESEIAPEYKITVHNPDDGGEPSVFVEKDS